MKERRKGRALIYRYLAYDEGSGCDSDGGVGQGK